MPKFAECPVCGGKVPVAHGMLVQHLRKPATPRPPAPTKRPMSRRRPLVIAVVTGAVAVVIATVGAYAAVHISVTRQVTYKVRAPLTVDDKSAQVLVLYRDADGALQQGDVQAPRSSTLKVEDGARLYLAVTFPPSRSASSIAEETVNRAWTPMYVECVITVDGRIVSRAVATEPGSRAVCSHKL